jgi:mRNA interferase HigB
MAMKIVGRNVLDDFGRRHADVVSQIEAWLCEVEEAQWQGPADLKRAYPKASILSGNRVVFNVKGNRYRLEAKIEYGLGIALVKRMGTHAEYSKWKL